MAIMAFTVPPVVPPSPLLSLPLPSPPPPLPLPLPSLYYSSFPLISLHILPVGKRWRIKWKMVNRLEC